MHYREVDWLPDVASYPELVQAYRDLGLLAGGCVVLDSGEHGIGPLAAQFDIETERSFLFEDERPVPILMSPDSTVTVEVSEFFGGPSVRMRTVLVNGALVETLRRWDAVPPWPTSLERARRHVRVEHEMTRASTLPGGRSIEIADGLPDQLLAAHQDHVARMVAHYGAEPYALESMDDVIALQNIAFAHADAVEGRAVGILLGSTVAVGLMILGLVVLGFAAELPVLWAVAVGAAVAAYLGFFRALVALRYWSGIRPAYAQLQGPSGG